MIFLLGNFQTGIVWLHYNANKSTITELFCVNKSKPELHCEGKCHVNAQIKKQQHDEQGVPTVDLRILDPCFPETANLTIKLQSGTIRFYPPAPACVVPELSDVFHPPQIG